MIHKMNQKLDSMSSLLTLNISWSFVVKVLYSISTCCKHLNRWVLKRCWTSLPFVILSFAIFLEANTQSFDPLRTNTVSKTRVQEKSFIYQQHRTSATTEYTSWLLLGYKRDTKHTLSYYPSINAHSHLPDQNLQFPSTYPWVIYTSNDDSSQTLWLRHNHSFKKF